MKLGDFWERAVHPFVISIISQFGSDCSWSLHIFFFYKNEYSYLMKKAHTMISTSNKDAPNAAKNVYRSETFKLVYV